MDHHELQRHSLQQVDPGYREFSISYHTHDMASCVRHNHDPDSCSHHNALGWPQVGEDDWTGLPASNRAHWSLLQFIAHLWQCYVSLLECSLYSDAKGEHFCEFPSSLSLLTIFQATTPVAVLFATWGLGLAQPNMKVFFNVSFIVLGVVIASFGEIKFKLIGFLFQIGGVIFEAIRLVMVQRLLSSAEFKMDPLVSFYYFAPVCAMMNGLVALFIEFPSITLADISRVGYFTLLANAMVAFMLNVCVVFLIGKTSSLVLTLCGVLKDILLVFASIMIWGTPVTPLQFFGYSIALGGMVYYKLGADSLKSFFSESNRRWAEYGAKRPAQRKMLVFGVVIVLLLVILIGLAPTLGYNADTAVKESKGWFSGLLGSTGGMVEGKLPQ